MIGIIGILFFDRSFFVKSTAFNLLLMCVLLFYTGQGFNKWFILFAALCFITGISVELVGTKTDWFFGEYKYGNVLGPAFQNVPLIIGVNWFIIIYCAGITVQTILNKIIERVSPADGPKPTLKAISVIIDGATIAILFDYLMEPVALKLGYWKWGGNGEIPAWNYSGWFIVSALLLVLFHYLKFHKQNKFAVNLLLIQAMFFLLLRTFL